MMGNNFKMTQQTSSMSYVLSSKKVTEKKEFVDEVLLDALRDKKLILIIRLQFLFYRLHVILTIIFIIH